MNRKAQFGFDVPNFIPRAIFYLIMVFGSIMVASMILRADIDVLEGETKLIITSLLTSPEGFMYTENGRVHLGIVDLDRFNYATVSKAFHLVQNPQRYWGYNITLMDTEGKVIKSVVENKVWHNRWKVIAGATSVGQGAAIDIIERVYVRIRSGDVDQPGVLVIDITRPTQ